jgi:hypothetical protein
LPNITPLRANGNFGADRSGVVAGGIHQRDVNVAVSFYFCVNDAPCECVPLCSDGILASVYCVNLHPALALPMCKFAKVSPIESRIYPMEQA